MESAKVKFLQVEGREFVYERSYDVIKDTPKFAELLVPEKGKEPEKERRPRPMGNKRALAAARSEENPIERMLAKKMKMDEEKKKHDKEFEKQMLITMKESNDNAVMSVDPSTISDPTRRSYYELKQKEILASLMKKMEVEEAIVVEDDESSSDEASEDEDSESA